MKSNLFKVGTGILIPVIIATAGFAGYKWYSSNVKKQYQNKLKVIEIYTQNGEYDRALLSIDELLIQNPEDDTVQQYYRDIIAKKQEMEEEKRREEEEKQRQLEALQKKEQANLTRTMNKLVTLFDTMKEEDNKGNVIFMSTKTKELLEDGKSYYTNGNSLKAKKAFEEVLKINPDSSTASCYLAAIIYTEDPTKMENLDRAEKYAKASLRKDNDIELSHLILGKVYSIKGETSEAIHEYKEVIRLNPDNDDALESIATLYFNSNDYVNSKTYFKKLLSIKPNDPVAHYYKGICEYKMGDTNKGIRSIEESVSIHSGFYQGYFELGSIYYGENNYKKAIHYFEQANGIQQKFEHYYLLGECNFALDKLSIAEEQYKKALVISTMSTLDELSSVTLIYKRLVQIQVEAGNITQAYAYIDEGLKLNKNNHELYLLSAQLKTSQERYDEAIIDYNTSLSIHKDNYIALVEVGGLYNTTGNFVKAYNAGQQAVLLNEKGHEAYMVLGDSMKGVKDYMAARNWYEKGIEKTGDRADLYYGIGMCFKEEEDIQSAVANFEKSIASDKTFYKSYYELSECYMAMTQYVKAKESLMTLSTLNSVYSKQMNVDQKLKSIERQIKKNS
jgi:tetratricopeptide (TPR) repeat protein